MMHHQRGAERLTSWPGVGVEPSHVHRRSQRLPLRPQRGRGHPLHDRPAARWPVEPARRGTWGQQAKGTVLAIKAVETQGKGTVLATKAVEAQGKGTVLATKAVAAQGKGTVLATKAVQHKAKALSHRR